MEKKIVVKAKDLTKYYGNDKGIANVDFEVYGGEIYGFIGPNGAGKSTTIRTILNLIKKTSGNAEIFGLDTENNHEEIMENIGYLPSEVFYYDNMKVIDLLLYSASFYKMDCSKRIYDLAETLELDLTRKIDNLSFGNKKKVGIVQALLHSPKLIILDEPTSGLDPFIQQKFFNILKEERDKGNTVFFSSHVLSEVQKLCDRVAIIKDGSIVSVEEIRKLNKENYKRFTIESDTKITKALFNLKGVKDLDYSENKVSFVYNGNLNKIICKMTDLNVKNILVTEPTLEEIFMHYYSEEK